MTDWDFEARLERRSARTSLAAGCWVGAQRASAASAWRPGSPPAAATACRPTRRRRSKAIAKGEIAKTLYFANWPLYIDVDDKTKKRGTLVKFEKKYGTKVKYVEEVNDNTEFFGKVRQLYAQGNSGGRDIHVVTDWMAARMKRLGYVQKLDKSAMPNVDGEPDRRAPAPRVGQDTRVLGAVAERPDRDHLPQGQGQARAEEHQRHLRLRIQGQDDDAHRDARHASASCCSGWARTRRRRRSTTCSRRSTRSTRPRSPARSAASPATTTRRTSPRATRG